MFAFLAKQPTTKQFVLLFLAAFALRGITLHFFITPEQRYHQADSGDYHICGALLAYTGSFTRPDNGEPIFWRTPGYAAYLYPFYKWIGQPVAAFELHERTHRWALWVQIFLSSIVPILFFFLALQLTGNLVIAWLLAFIGIIHIGFILASTYLLTDALASIFFYLFLLCFMAAWFTRGQLHVIQRWTVLLAGAASFLACYTWMRPNGEFFALMTMIIMLFLPAISWKDRLKKPMLFGVVFFAALSPWYVRNYQSTGKLFFCPMAGAYMNAFCVPKIVRRLTGWNYTQCANAVNNAVAQETIRRAQARPAGDTTVISGYLVSREIAYPVVKQYPLYFLQDWIVEVIKTTFDLFSYQLVAIDQKCYQWDPPEEFLLTKLHATLLGPLPLWMRTIGWIELLLYLFVWSAVFYGAIFFVLQPLWNFLRYKTPLPTMTILWLICLAMFGGFVLQTGGFGYARLRIPVEPLLLIMALTFYFQPRKKDTLHG
jgi:hypothetical protein